LATLRSLVTYTKEEPLAYHANNFGGGGKIEVISKVRTRDVKDLTLAYSPGVAAKAKHSCFMVCSSPRALSFPSTP
jgi:malic enzyme